MPVNTEKSPQVIEINMLAELSVIEPFSIYIYMSVILLFSYKADLCDAGAYAYELESALNLATAFLTTSIA